MNKKGRLEYTCTKRQSTRRVRDMFENIVHDNEYTFADEYYNDLQRDYLEDLRKELDEE